MTNIIQYDFQGYQVSFNNDGWINATEAAKRFCKEPYDWLRHADTLEYLIALHDALDYKNVSRTDLNKINELKSGSGAFKRSIFNLSKRTGLVKTKSGSPETGGGTWLHPKLAVAFARWLSVEFAVWCDLQIDSLIRDGKLWKDSRREASLGYKSMQDAVKTIRQSSGKQTNKFHYINEARLINGVIKGIYKGLGRDQLSREELDLVIMLENRNTFLIGVGHSYQKRKSMLINYLSELTRKAVAA